MSYPPSQTIGVAIDDDGNRFTLYFRGEDEGMAVINRSPTTDMTLQMQQAETIFSVPAATPQEASVKLLGELEARGLRLVSLLEKVNVVVIIQYDQWPNPTKLTSSIRAPQEVLRDLDAVIDDVFRKYEGHRVTPEVLDAAYSEIHSRIERGEWPWKDRFNASPGCIVWSTVPTH